MVGRCRASRKFSRYLIYPSPPESPNCTALQAETGEETGEFSGRRLRCVSLANISDLCRPGPLPVLMRRAPRLQCRPVCFLRHADASVLKRREDSEGERSSKDTGVLELELYGVRLSGKDAITQRRPLLDHFDSILPPVQIHEVPRYLTFSDLCGNRPDVFDNR